MDMSLDLGQAELSRLQGTQPAGKGRVSSTLQLSEVTSTSTTRADGLAVFSQETLGGQVWTAHGWSVRLTGGPSAARCPSFYTPASDPQGGERTSWATLNRGGCCAQPNSMAKMLSRPCPMPILQMDKVRLREGQAHVQSCGDQGPVVIPTEGCVIPLSV